MYIIRNFLNFLRLTYFNNLKAPLYAVLAGANPKQLVLGRRSGDI